MSSFRRGARMTLIDFHLTTPIRTTNKTLNKLEKEISDKGQERDIFKAVKKSYEQGIKDILEPNFISTETFMDKVDKKINSLSVIPNSNYQNMSIESDKNMVDTNEGGDVPFYVYNRNDVVSRYVGDTAHRCTKAMNDALNGVAYFDEAYNLCNDRHGLTDSYGREALTTINQYMDEHSDKLIVVFAGYKEDIYNNLFKSQKGLESRFTHKFEIERYDYKELTEIFIQRLKYSEWHISNSDSLQKLIQDNYKLFEYQGRDMDTLALYTKNIISERIFDDILGNDNFTNVITDLNIIKEAIEIFRNNMLNTKKDSVNNDDISRVFDLLRN